MHTFCIQTLGCKVNQYEGEQLAELLRARGLVAAPADRADLRIVHTCSVTVQAASKSRQTVRRAVRLPVVTESRAVHDPARRTQVRPALPERGRTVNSLSEAEPSAAHPGSRRPRVVVTGCWATSDREAAAALPGVDAVLSHREDVAAELDRLLALWREAAAAAEQPAAVSPHASPCEVTRREPLPEAVADDRWNEKAGSPAGGITSVNKSKPADVVKKNPAKSPVSHGGMTRLPILGNHQAGRQRAFLKVQDGCDAHCTYCIIPSLRPGLWSKPVNVVIDEANALVAAGHVELVLTGIFLGAYGQPTALRRRQPDRSVGATPMAELVDALCTRVPGMRRLRLSSLEPGDLTPELIAVLRGHAAVVPHFHLPLQSGSDRLLRRMNRQYGRDDFSRMLDRVHDAFDRPALTTDVIVGFPGETDAEFRQTVEVCDRAGFIHVHAFSYSPRPGTAAARWAKDFIRGPVVNERIDHLAALAARHGLGFRQQFLGDAVELLVEAEGCAEDSTVSTTFRHGRCARYFDVTIPAAGIRTGDFVRARVTRVTQDETFGEVLR